MIEEEFEQALERALRIRAAALAVTPQPFDEVIRAAAKKRLERQPVDEDTVRVQLDLEHALSRRAATVQFTPAPFDQIISAAAARTGRAPFDFGPGSGARSNARSGQDFNGDQARLDRLNAIKHRVPQANVLGANGDLPLDRESTSPRGADWSGANQKPDGSIARNSVDPVNTGGSSRPKFAVIGAVVLSIVSVIVWWISKASDTPTKADATVVVEQNSPGSGSGARSGIN